MADCNDLFQLFYGKIVLTVTKKKELRKSKDAIRDKIKSYFKDELKKNAPLFFTQGSYKMGTNVNPIDGEYDIDDGVYLQLDADDSPEVATVHTWICNAVDGHTDEEPTDKNTCIRVRYAGKYHVDLPIYKENNGKFDLADKGKGWHESDSKALADWYKDQKKEKGEQFQKIICLLKAWQDNKSKSGKLANGLILTVLAYENYENDERDDLALQRTLKNMARAITKDVKVTNPIDADENLGDRLSEVRKKRFYDCIQLFSESSEKAIDEDSKKKACKLWFKEFGDRFTDCDEVEEEEPKKTTSPVFLQNDDRSAK
ncbi:MAG: hypothetical protein KAS32_30875 [Candidatus Peribacteraceae bacterium]|nr:hypothetical protein [Candidatus Peribacteraceae bacterium]